MSANGDVISSYAWGLGTDSNNKAKFCGLLQGLKIAISKGMANLIVFGDSRLLIQSLTRRKRPGHINLAQIYHKIQTLSNLFQSIKFYHVLRELNQLADAEANRGVCLGRGILIKDGEESRCDI